MSKPNNIDFNTYLRNFKQHIANLKLKNTLQKDYILKILFHSDKHLTVEEITSLIRKKYNLDIAITTVYKSVKLFEELKFVTSLEIEGNPRLYELNQFIHHNHLICTSCLKIIDFTDQFTEDRQHAILKKHNFILDSRVLTIYGLCKECQN
jgi:Fur family ferric uptake transcriptional regulator